VTSPSEVTMLGGDGQVGGNFLLEVDGVEIGMFQSVSGLQVTVQTEDLVEGGQNGFTRKLPSRMEWPNIVLSRGLIQSDNLFDWISKTSGEGFAASGNKLQRCTGAITALGQDGTRLRAWNLANCFPVRWKGPEFNVTSNDALSEELEITHEGFRSETQK
jgi:phage tail-like protein